MSALLFFFVNFTQMSVKGLFRGRGDHPKMGTVKHRINPEDVTINCSKDKIPEPPTGHEWKEVLHDKTGTWLARWKENINVSVVHSSISDWYAGY